MFTLYGSELVRGKENVVDDHAVVSHDDWLEARKQLLAKEKEFTRTRDQMTAQQRSLPWEAVERDYVFQAPAGDVSLDDLFDGRSQLLVYHFMFDPEDDVGCPVCSFWADNFDPLIVHLGARDVTMVAISQAPLSKITPYKKRMGWNFPWFSSYGSDSTTTTAFRSGPGRPTRLSTTTTLFRRAIRNARG